MELDRRNAANHEPRELRRRRLGQPDPSVCSAALFRWLKTCAANYETSDLQKGVLVVILRVDGAALALAVSRYPVPRRQS